MNPIDLPAAYHDLLARTMDEQGFEIPHAFGLDPEGAMTMFALALPVPDAYRVMLGQWGSGKFVELIFAFDRYTRPGQGTTLGDLMAGWHFTRSAARPFIVEYRFDPREMLPINWENAHWNQALAREAAAMFGAVRGVS